MSDINKKLEDGWVEINRDFPFENYINPARKSGYLDMVKKVEKWSGTDVDVLDFGAGPCDKTALFSKVGMRVTAFDNLNDSWVLKDGNRQKILDFAKDANIEYIMPTEEDPYPWNSKMYDVIMSHDVLEHFHSSPRILLNKLLECLKPGGLLITTVPNAANIRKRLHLAVGKTNYNRYDYFYWYPGPWNGHVREYVKNDLVLLNKYLKLEEVSLTSYHLQLDALPAFLRKPFVALSHLMPGARDSWMLVSRKPSDWTSQTVPSKEQIKSSLGWHYFDMSKYEYDWESED
jgi:2-polyprenyl-3-methyl-5-hydroxy-6-metoxy-1,4-benzoquinol methylase